MLPDGRLRSWTRKFLMKRIRIVPFPILLGLLLATELWSQVQPIPEGLSNGQAARFVLGQKNFSDITFGATADRLGAISGIAQAGDKLIVADSSYLAPPNNNRVLIYNNFSSFAGEAGGRLVPADVVVGQPDFTSSAFGTSATSMNQPVGVASDGVRLFVADWGNNRVLIFNRIPETNGAAADVVVGQSGFTISDFGTGPQRLRRPNSVSTDGTRLFITDTLNNRVVIYNRIPTQNGASADLVLGQNNFDNRQALPTAANTLSSPMSATTDGQRLIVADLGNNRILIYNRIPTQSGAAADVVVGQPNFASNAPGNTATTLNFPRYAYSDGQRLLIVDSGNNRILIYNQVPTQNGAAADIVLGQLDFLGLLESCAASNIAVPYSAFSHGDTLFVSDGFNRRVLAFRPGMEMIASKGIVNAASFSGVAQAQACGVILAQPPLAPGGMASLFGSNLADTTMEASSFPLPRELGGVQLKINGAPVPLFFVSPSQINFQVPFGLTGFSASVEIEKKTAGGTVVSAAAALSLATGAPGIFTAGGTGRGRGIVTHADFTPVTPESPAKSGETLSVFVTGLGTVDHPVTDGEPVVFGARGSVSIQGPFTSSQNYTITVNNVTYSYTSTAGEGLEASVFALAGMIDKYDPTVSATADVSDIRVLLRARDFGDQGTSITYSASPPAGATITDGFGLPQQVPGSVAFQGIPQAGQTVTITLSESAFSYNVSAGDTLETVVNALTDQINNDPNVVAAADPANGVIVLELRNPDAGLKILYTASLSPDPRLNAIVQGATVVPGRIELSGTVTSGQTVNVILRGTLYSYATLPEDTLETVVNALVAQINQDPNVAATAELENLQIVLHLRNPDLGLAISIAASVAATPPFQVATAYQHFIPGIAEVVNDPQAIIGEALALVPGTILFGGTPQPGETITMFLLDSAYSYTMAEGDTLETIVSSLVNLLNQDPNVSAAADTANLVINLQLRDSAKNLSISFRVSLPPDGTLAALTQSAATTGPSGGLVTFAGLVKGFVGLYQVNFTLPALPTNPNTKLTLRQSLITLGLPTGVDIYSNTVEFAVGESVSE